MSFTQETIDNTTVSFYLQSNYPYYGWTTCSWQALDAEHFKRIIEKQQNPEKFRILKVSTTLSATYEVVLLKDTNGTNLSTLSGPHCSAPPQE